MISSLYVLIRRCIESRYSIFFVIGAALALPKVPYASVILPTLLPVLMFINFLTIKPKRSDLFGVSSLLYLVLVLVIYPTVLYLLSNYIPQYLYTGLFIACITPTAIAAPVMTDLVHGNISRMTGHVLLANLLAPITFGIHFLLFMKNTHVTIPFLPLVTKIALIIIIPMVVAKIITRIYPRTESLNPRLLKKGLFLFLVFIAASNASPALKGIAPLKALLIFCLSFTLASLLYLSGFAFGKDSVQKRTEALMFGHKNIGLSIWITLSYFNESAALPLVLYIVSHHIINGLLIARFQNRLT